jgi:hypothetical protein
MTSRIEAAIPAVTNVTRMTIMYACSLHFIMELLNGSYESTVANRNCHICTDAVNGNLMKLNLNEIEDKREREIVERMVNGVLKHADLHRGMAKKFEKYSAYMFYGFKEDTTSPDFHRRFLDYNHLAFAATSPADEDLEALLGAELAKSGISEELAPRESICLSSDEFEAMYQFLADIAEIFDLPDAGYDEYIDYEMVRTDFNNYKPSGPAGLFLRALNAAKLTCVLSIFDDYKKEMFFKEDSAKGHAFVHKIQEIAKTRRDVTLHFFREEPPSTSRCRESPPRKQHLGREQHAWCSLM